MTLIFIIAMVLVPAWAYLVGAAIAAVRFAAAPSAHRRRAAPCSRVLKPLHGAEPGLYENLRSFAEQDYPVVQLVLGVSDADDGALPAARAVDLRPAGSDIALVVDAPS